MEETLSIVNEECFPKDIVDTNTGESKTIFKGTTWTDVCVDDAIAPPPPPKVGKDSGSFVSITGAAIAMIAAIVCSTTTIVIRTCTSEKPSGELLVLACI